MKDSIKHINLVVMCFLYLKLLYKYCIALVCVNFDLNNAYPVIRVQHKHLDFIYYTYLFISCTTAVLH